jgi:hypothetical protein
MPSTPGTAPIPLQGYRRYSFKGKRKRLKNNFQAVPKSCIKKILSAELLANPNPFCAVFLSLSAA